MDNPGSGYSTAPNVVLRDGTLADPIVNGGTGATASAGLEISSIVVDNPGDGYITAPTVTITDPTGSGATATATVNAGSITGLTLDTAGSGYITDKGIKKFQDALPGLCTPPACPTTGKYIPVGVPEAKKYNNIEADEYVIGLVQYRTSFSSSLEPTLVRGYVQLETPANAGVSQHFPLHERAARRHQGRRDWSTAFRPTPSPRRSGWARRSLRRRTSRCGSCSATCCPPAPTVTCSCPWTAR